VSRPEHAGVVSTGWHCWVTGHQTQPAQ